MKEKKNAEQDIQAIDIFNCFMLDRWLFILIDWQVTMNPEKVYHWQYEYTMAMAIEDFKKL